MLPKNFNFSQNNLQDFVDCPRRFQLRHIDHCVWPAIEAEPVLEHEREVQMGAFFHHLIHQHLLGVSERKLSAMVNVAPLNWWWQAYLEYWKNSLVREDTHLYPEISLTVPFDNHHLVAKYDLIIVFSDNGVQIIDWKTSRQPPSPRRRRWLETRLQTRLYRYLLARTAEQLANGRPIQPDGIEMLYWFANSPQQPESFPYNTVLFNEDERYLATLIHHIEQLEEDDFPMTTDAMHCRFCVYRSLCDRGLSAGNLTEGEAGDFEANEEINFDFSETDEISY